MTFRITTDKVAPQKFKSNLAGLADRDEEAMTAAMNMAASMISAEGKASIAAAGKFGDRWTTGLHVEVEGQLGNMRISMTHDVPYAGIFETGGTIHGNPMLWIPLSFSDAVGIEAKDYGDQLFSIQRPQGAPLLLSMSDHLPKYFGVESVTIPPKFHLREIQMSVMANFRTYFDTAFKTAAR